MTTLLSWCSKKQSVVTLSSCEAEYIASGEAACQCLWLEYVLKDLKINYKRPIQMFVDNKSAIDLSKNPVCHRKSKHIETKYHFLCDQVMKNRIDIFTKPLRHHRFEKLRSMLGLIFLDNMV